MSDEHVYTIWSRYLQKMTEVWHKTCQKQALFTSFRDYCDFLNFIFDRFWRFKKYLRVIFAFLAKIWTKNMYRSSKSRFFCLTFYTWWPEMTLTCIMVPKYRKWYLQMSVTLFMPIHWLCLPWVCLLFVWEGLCNPPPSPAERGIFTKRINLRTKRQ